MEKTEEEKIISSVPRGTYTDEITQKLSLKHALRVSLWIFAIFACIGGMLVCIIAGGTAYFAIGNIGASALSPIDSAQMTVLDLANVVSELRASGEYLNAAGNMSDSLDGMASALEDISNSVSSIQSIPLIGGQFGGLSEAGVKIDESAKKMRMAANSIESASVGIEDAMSGLEGVEDNLRDASISIAGSKKVIGGSVGMIQISVVGFTLAIECVFLCTLGVALSYGPPKERKN